MKIKIFTISILTLLSVFFLVSCSQDEITIQKSDNKSGKAMAMPIPHGKLIIENGTPFEFFDDVSFGTDNGCLLEVYGAQNGVFDPNIRLALPIRIMANSALNIESYKTPFTNGYTLPVYGDRWFISDGVNPVNSVNTSVANDLYRSVDANGLSYINWGGIKTSGQGTGVYLGKYVPFYFVCDPLTGEILIPDDYKLDTGIYGPNIDYFRVEYLVTSNGDTIISMSIVNY